MPTPRKFAQGLRNETDGTGLSAGRRDDGKGVAGHDAVPPAGRWLGLAGADCRNGGVFRRGGHRLPCAQGADAAHGRDVFARRLRLRLSLLRDARHAQRGDRSCRPSGSRPHSRRGGRVGSWARNRENLVDSERLWIERTDGPAPRFKATTRVGIGYASKRDQSRKWRFLINGSRRQKTS